MTYRDLRTFAPFLVLSALLGCGAAQPPQYLVDARKAYNDARAGHAATLTPAELHTAKVALTKAEESHEAENDPESAQTIALSYVALRQSQMVQSLANTRAAKRDLAATDEERQAIRDSEIKRTRAELARAKQRLAVRDEQLGTAEEQLSRERTARAAAEKRERDAMQKLAAAAAINVKEEARGTVIVLPGNVLFASGKYALTAAAQRKLTLVAGTLAPQAENHDVVVEGHTDSRGDRMYNMTLAENRARAVMEYLASRGVAAESMTSVGIGPDRPIANNGTRAGRAENRRVEIIVKPIEPK